MLATDFSCATMQVTRAGVVPQAGPKVQHRILWCGRKVLDRRERGHESLVIGNHSRHLSLLQHDLGDPDTVGRPVLLPGQIFASVAVKPVQQGIGNVIG